MLGSKKIMAFICTRDAKRAREFYEGLLGLRFVADDGFALVFDANGIMVRVAKAKELTPAQFTVLGWEVPEIAKTVAGLEQKGIHFEKYGFPGQDEQGICTFPGGAKVAWFKDPDGNVLSLTEFPESRSI